MEELAEIHELLEEIKRKNLLVVIEGIKDKRSLESFGIKNILTLNKALYAVVEEIAATAKEVVLLTDLDNEGKKLYSVLSRDLQKHGVKIDNRLRELLFKTPLRHLEGLQAFLARAQVR